MPCSQPDMTVIPLTSSTGWDSNRRPSDCLEQCFSKCGPRDPLLGRGHLLLGRGHLLLGRGHFWVAKTCVIVVLQQYMGRQIVLYSVLGSPLPIIENHWFTGSLFTFANNNEFFKDQFQFIQTQSHQFFLRRLKMFQVFSSGALTQASTCQVLIYQLSLGSPLTISQTVLLHNKAFC